MNANIVFETENAPSNFKAGLMAEASLGGQKFRFTPLGGKT